jgi:hypothetical protein
MSAGLRLFGASSDPAAAGAPVQSLPFLVGPSGAPGRVELSTVADMQGDRPEAEHCSKAGEVGDRVVVKGRVGRSASERAHEGAGDELAGYQVSVVDEDGDRSGDVAGCGHDTGGDVEAPEAVLDEVRFDRVGGGVQGWHPTQQRTERAGGQVGFSGPAGAIRFEVGVVGGDGGRQSAG